MNYDGFINKTVESVFNSEFIANTTFRKPFCFWTVCWGDSFEFLLQAYNLPDSGFILPHLKALLRFVHWILFILLLHWLLPVLADLSFLLLGMRDRNKLLIMSQSLQKSVFLWSIYPYWCRVGTKLGCASLQRSVNDCGFINWNALCGKRFSFGKGWLG